MVAISLYRGNLHRSSDAPIQWLMPTRKISLKDFEILLHRRSRALSLLQSPTSNPNPNPNSDYSGREQPHLYGSLEYIVKYANASKLDDEKLVDELHNLNEDDNAKKGSTGDDCLVIPSGELVTLEVADAKAVVTENGSNAAVDDLRQVDKTQATLDHQLVPSKDDTLSDKEKRKKEVDEKLQILNERKHKLVQVLKQILHAEEELRRRSNVQGRPSISLQVDVTNDSGSMSKHMTPGPGSEGNCGGDVEGAYGDDVSNQNMHSRNITRISSMSPSSDLFIGGPPPLYQTLHEGV